VSGAPLVVCADDFGMTDPINAAVLGLIERGRINAASCMTQGPAWTTGARALAALRTDVQLGLHFELPSPWLSAEDAKARLCEQWALFVSAVGRAPDFIDGHRHVHLFPGPRTALFAFLNETGARPWIRQCETAAKAGSWKRWVLDPLSASLRREARRRGLAVNPGFGGLRRFDPAEDVASIWRRDLAAMAGRGGVLMIHPGGPGGDALAACRAQETALIEAGALAEAIWAAGLTLAEGLPAWA
jgi:predicted glycoside hydrolase/deacetylase ChbG (UPF0249 family)